MDEQKSGLLRTRLQKTLVSVSRTIVILAVSVVLLRLAILQMGDFDSTPAELRSWQAVFDGSLFFGGQFGTPDWLWHLKNLGYTMIMVTTGLMWSAGLALLLGVGLARRPHGRVWDGASNLATVLSSFPLFVVGLAAFDYWFFRLASLEDPDFFNQLPKLLVGGILLGTCEGALGEWPRIFRSILTTLQSSTYYLACSARGQSTLRLAYLTLRPYFWDSLATRISYLFGGAIIIEYTVDFRALGWTLIENIRSDNLTLAYREAMIAGLLLILTPLIIRMVIEFLMVRPKGASRVSLTREHA